MALTSIWLPPQKPQPCTFCRTTNWLPIPPNAPISGVCFFNCWKCGATFQHIVGSGLTLYLVRCASLLVNMWPLLLVCLAAAAVYSAWLLLHWLGVLPLAALLILCVGLAHDERHPAIASLPAALMLFLGAAALTRFSLLYLLHRTEHVNGMTALILLFVGSCVFGAPAAEYYPEAVYDGLQTYGAGGLIDTPEAYATRQQG